MLWRVPRHEHVIGRKAIIATAHKLDQGTRYLEAAPALTGEGLTLHRRSEDEEWTPSVIVEGEPYGLTQEAGANLFQRIGLSIRHLGDSNEIETKTATLVKAACASAYGRSQLDASRLVVDDEERTVNGIVSQMYTPIPHAQLAEGMRLKDPATATVRGTKLRILDGKADTFIAPGGDRGGDDRLKIQVEGLNSLAGESSFSIGSYIYRTICRNGLMGLVAGERYRAEHRGNRETLDVAIVRILAEADICIAQTKKMINELISVRLTPKTLGANAATCEAIANSLETLRARPLAIELKTAAREGSTTRATECIHRMIAETGPKEARAVLKSPYRSGEATGWDFVNLATAAARQIHPIDSVERDEAERTAGRLGQTLIAQRKALEPA